MPRCVPEIRQTSHPNLAHNHTTCQVVPQNTEHSQTRAINHLPSASRPILSAEDLRCFVIRPGNFYATQWAFVEPFCPGKHGETPSNT